MNRSEKHILDQTMEVVFLGEVKFRHFERQFIVGIDQFYRDKELTYRQVTTLITIHDKAMKGVPENLGSPTQIRLAV